MKKNSLFHFLGNVYKVLIGILAPICLLRSLFVFVLMLLDVKLGVIQLPVVGMLYIWDHIQLNWWGYLHGLEFYEFGIALISIVFSHQFVRIFLPKISSKKSLLLFLLYYLLIALSCIGIAYVFST